MNPYLSARLRCLADARGGEGCVWRIAHMSSFRGERRNTPQEGLDDESYLRSALKAGGSGYLLKRAVDAELLSAIRAVYQGGTYLHPHHTRLLLADVAEQRSLATGAGDEKRRRYHLLSERESEVFELVALGYRNSEIAEKLHLSVKTVETYKTRLMQKLGLRSRAALVRYALQLGILAEEAA